MAAPLRLAFVDLIASTEYLIDRLHQDHIQVMAISTPITRDMDQASKLQRLNHDLYDDVIDIPALDDQTVDQTVSLLKQHAIDYIFYGSDNLKSVHFTDQVASALHPDQANDPETSFLRCDKYEMQSALKKAGLPSVKQMKIEATLNENQKQALNTWDFPVIIKPTNASGTLGLKKIYSLENIEAFVTQSDHRSLEGRPIFDYVIQECLIGEEYVVDSFSFMGHIYVAAVYRYKKLEYNGYPIYRHLTMVDPKSLEWKTASEFTIKSLKILGMKNGFSHIELFLTQTGPKLVEINPRISGIFGMLNRLAEKTLETSQPQLLCSVLKKESVHLPTRLKEKGMVIFLQSWIPKKMGPLNIAWLQTLASYKEYSLYKKEGEVLSTPKTLLDTVGFILLRHTEDSILERDYESILQYELEGKLF